MAEKIVSPGVFTNEKDLSFLPAGIAAIGAAIIGPTSKGPAFVPTIVENFDEFIAKFGGLSETTYVPYAVKSYLAAASTVTIVRVLQEGGYASDAVHIIHKTAVDAAATLDTLVPGADYDTATGLATTGGSGAGLTVDITAVAGAITVVTINNPGSGYTIGNTLAIIQTGATAGTINVATLVAGGVEKLVGVILPTKNTADGASNGNGFEASDFFTSGFQNGSVTGSFGFQLSGSGVSAQNLTASANPNSTSNLENVLGTSAQGAKKGYMYTWYDNHIKSSINTLGETVSFVTTSLGANVDYSSSNAGDAQKAATPYITSQIIGNEKLDLFKVKTLADGTDTNTSLKVSIINQTLPGGNPASDYGSFLLLVREYSDTDQRPVVLESFSNLTLDPDSSNYISRRIGDRYRTVSDAGVVTINGDYDNISQYVYIDAVDDVKAKAITPNVKPWGFDAYVQPISSSFIVPTAAFITQDTIIRGAFNKKAYYGFDFATTSDNGNLLKPLAAGTIQIAGNDFNLDDCFIYPSASGTDANSTIVGGASISGSIFAGVDISNFLKFTIGLQGGYDGDDPAITKNMDASILPSNTMGLDCTSASSPGTIAYVKALQTINNPDELDVNLIVAPGCTIADHSAVTNKMIEVAEDRGDCFTLIDPVSQGNTLGAAVSAITSAGLDTSYAGTYWPWLKILDTDKNKPVWVPPSVVLPRVFANSDNVAYEWFAPAGLNRGGISEAIDIEAKLQQSNRDDLYENRINPIATFPNQGIVAWGQKTLQAKPSALDRINVRRLLIALKKFIASSSRYLVFENNTTETRQRFLNIVSPYLETVKSRQGLYAYRVVMDESNNTPDVIDRNEMYGQIFIQPAKAAEFIVLDFNILPTGATFDS